MTSIESLAQDIIEFVNKFISTFWNCLFAPKKFIRAIYKVENNYIKPTTFLILCLIFSLSIFSLYADKLGEFADKPSSIFYTTTDKIANLTLFEKFLYSIPVVLIVKLYATLLASGLSLNKPNSEIFKNYFIYSTSTSSLLLSTCLLLGILLPHIAGKEYLSPQSEVSILFLLSAIYTFIYTRKAVSTLYSFKGIFIRTSIPFISAFFFIMLPFIFSWLVTFAKPNSIQLINILGKQNYYVIHFSSADTLSEKTYFDAFIVNNTGNKILLETPIKIFAYSRNDKNLVFLCIDSSSKRYTLVNDRDILPIRFSSDFDNDIKKAEKNVYSAYLHFMTPSGEQSIHLENIRFQVASSPIDDIEIIKSD